MDNELQLSRVASRLFGQPLFLLPETAETIGRYVAGRRGGSIDPHSSRFVGEPARDVDDRPLGYRVDGRVAVITTSAELVNRGAYVNASSGVASYEGIEELFARAGQDRDVEFVVHDITSPGGEAYQMVDTVRSCRSVVNGKPVTTVVNGMAASAGYGLACIGDEIVIGESAVAGSIGVVILHLDHSKMLEDMGLKATFIHVGETKVLGNGFEALSKEARGHLQSKVEECMDGFAGLVADFRPKLSIEQIRDLEADTFMGQHAIDVGLADRIGTVRSVVDELNSARGGRIFSSKKGLLMENKDGSPEANETTGITQSQLDQAVATARQEGRAEGVSATAERYNTALNAEGVKGNVARMGAAIELLGKSAEMAAEDVAAFVTENVAEAVSEDTVDETDYDDQRSDAADLTTPPKNKSEKSGLSALMDKKLGKK